MIASGSDDGTFSIRDLRLIKGGSLVAHFEYHKHPATSIEWSPHEASTLAVSSADNQLMIWDLSLERDEEEEAEFKAKMKEQVNAPMDLPPQLPFVHQLLFLRSDGPEGIALAPADSRNACFYRSRWVQYSHAFEYWNNSSNCRFLTSRWPHPHSFKHNFVCIFYGLMKQKLQLLTSR